MTVPGSVSRVHQAALVTQLHFGFCLLVQVENSFVYDLWPEDNFVAHVLARQMYTFGFAVALGLLCFLLSLAPRRAKYAASSVYVFVVILCNLWVICDQVGYKVSNDHLKMSMNDQSLDARKTGIIFGSFVAELDWIFLLNLLVLILTSVRYGPFILAQPRVVDLKKEHLVTERKFEMTTWMKAMVVYFLLNLFACGFGYCGSSDSQYDRLEIHPIYNFLTDLFSSKLNNDILTNSLMQHVDFNTKFLQNLTGPLTMAKVYEPYQGKLERESLGMKWMAQYRHAIVAERTASVHKKKNVVVYIMESVGSKQLLGKDGIADPALAPNFAQLQKNSVTFNKIYDTFPSTTRTHIPMATGGLTSTQGSIEGQSRHKYTGQTITSTFKANHYKTGLFAASDLAFEGLDRFYKFMGYEKFHHYGIADKLFKKRAYLNSWGGDDHTMVEEMLKWVDEDKANTSKKPFFVHLLPDSTHHPYSVPRGYKKTFTGGDTRLDRYKNAIHYTDFALGTLIDGLKKRGLWQNTLLIVTGDHGEAFGGANKDHPRNFLHKNFLYDENIVSFLMLHDPGVSPPKCYQRKQQASGINLRGGKGKLHAMVPCVSSHSAAVADTFPTTVAFALGDVGVPRPVDGIPGQNLLSPQYKLRMHFFHKTASPYQWGLRDGPFKMISNQIGKHVELYDLSVDPLEQNNLAQSKKELVDVYENRVQLWFTHVHCWFTSQLAGWPQGGTCDEKSLESSPNMRERGPKRLVFGKGGQKDFSKVNHLTTSMAAFTVFNEWIPYQSTTSIIFDFAPVELHHGLQRSVDQPKIPKHSQYTIQDRYLQRFQVQKGWHSTWYKMNVPNMKPGKWELILWSGDDSQTSTQLLSSTIDVRDDHREKKTKSASNPCSSVAKEVTVGYLDNTTKRLFHEIVPGGSGPDALPRVNNKTPQIVIQTRWQACNRPRTIVYNTADPSNEIYKWTQTLKPGWVTTWYYFHPNQPVKTSKWQLTMLDKSTQRMVGSAAFEVTGDVAIPNDYGTSTTHSI